MFFFESDIKKLIDKWRIIFLIIHLKHKKTQTLMGQPTHLRF